MPLLFCLVQRLTLADDKRTLIRGGETFEVDAATAEMYVKGGIAKPADVAPAPVKVSEPAPVPEAPATEPEKTVIDTKKKRR